MLKFATFRALIYTLKKSLEMKKRLLLILPTNTYRTEAFMSAAYNIDIVLTVGTETKRSLADFTPGTTMVVSIYDHKKALEQIAGFHKSYPLAAIVGVDENTVLIAAKASAEIGLAHNPVAAVQAAADKFLFRKQISDSGLDSPAFELLAEDQQSLIDFPIVLKPRILSAGRGVMRVDSEQQLQTAVPRIRAILDSPKLKRQAGSAAESLLAESYIPGEEVAVEGLVEEGRFHLLAIYDKPDPLSGPTFAETIYVTPSRHPRHIQQDIENTVQKAVRAIGLLSGPVHAELRFNESGVFMIELANRSIGGLCSRILAFENDMTIEEVILRQALGLLNEIPKRSVQASGVMMIPVGQTGTLISVSGVKAAKSTPGISDVLITIPNNTKVQALPEGNRYLGFIFAEAQQAETVEQALRTAYSQLRIKIAPKNSNPTS